MEKISNRIGIPGAVESLIGGREENQDDFGFAETQLGLLVVVCDGMGGGPAGRTASSLARETIIRQLSEAKITDKPETVMYNAVVAANNALLGAIAAKPELQGMGTTCVCLLVNRKYAYIAHVGDSRCYQLRRGQTVFRTADHSYVGELVRRNTISEEEARLSKYSNVITRAIGVGQTVEPDIDKVTVRPGDRFALMTDGIWGTMPENQLVENLSHPGDPAIVVSGLAHKVDQLGINNGGGHDNLTLAIVQLPGVLQQQPIQPQPVKQPVGLKVAAMPKADTKPNADAGKDKVTDQTPSDSDLHITITELADEGASRRKSIWIWILSILLVAVIGVMTWLLLQNKDNDAADDKSKYDNVDTRTKTKDDDDETHGWHDWFVGQEHSTPQPTSTRKNQEKETDVERIIEKGKDGKDSPKIEAVKQDNPKDEHNRNMTKNQQTLSGIAASLEALIKYYNAKSEIKRYDDNGKECKEWKDRNKEIKGELENILKNTKKATRMGESNFNRRLYDIIGDIKEVAEKQKLIDDNRGKPTREIVDNVNKIVHALKKLSHE